VSGSLKSNLEWQANKITVLVVIGTRPEAIKMALVIQELKRFPEQITCRVCVTAQHRDMLDQALSQFDIVPDFDLDLMRMQQTPLHMMRLILEHLEPIVLSTKADWLLVHGDTITAMAAAMVAAFHGIRVGHVEAGLRTWDNTQPFPEEMNRRIIDVVASLYFAPTISAKNNLLLENIREQQITVTGNTVIDALKYISEKPFDWANSDLSKVPLNKRLILVTTHRRENFGSPLQSICQAVQKLAALYQDSVHIVFPVHRNQNVYLEVHRMLDGIANISLLEPLDYLNLVHLLKRCVLVLTDSGGLQEEAPSFGIPIIVLRNTTERHEMITLGGAYIVGTETQKILEIAQQLLESTDKRQHLPEIANPFGDGQASKRIVEALLQYPLL
jgi:UDP-N-acetylglucosamine 2-epimerase (non-hydrolysing)